MAESVPLHFGGRMQAVVRNRNAMMEAMLEASPDLATAFERGVDVRLGTACLGLYVNQVNLNWMPGKLAALADEKTGVTLVRFHQAIVATGRRDMGLAFPGWEQPGILGSTAAVILARRYRALEGRRAVILGSSAEALLDALALRDEGVEVAAIIEQAKAPVGPEALTDRIAACGIPLLCGEAVRRAGGSAMGGVESVLLSGGRTIACDLVVLAVGTVPVVDLLDAAGCRLEFSSARNGFRAGSFPRRIDEPAVDPGRRRLCRGLGGKERRSRRRCGRGQHGGGDGGRGGRTGPERRWNDRGGFGDAMRRGRCLRRPCFWRPCL